MSPLLDPNEQTIRAVSPDGGTVCYYGFELALTQADVPCTIVAGRREASQFHFVVCADTVTLAGPLVNPGKDIRISARQVVLSPGAVLDTCGADPAVSFEAGQLPQQPSVAPAAPGAAGGGATDGLPAGNVQLLAEAIVVGGAATPGPLAVQALLSAAAPLAPAPFTIALSVDGNSSYSLAVSSVQVAGASGALRVADPVAVLAGGGLQLGFSLALSIGASVALTGQVFGQQLSLAGGMSAAGVIAAVQATTGPAGGTGAATVVVTLSGFAPVFTTDVDGAAFPDIGAAAIASIEAQLVTALQPLLATALSGVPGDLLVLANGGPGGRGQDGGPGNQGSLGAAGQAVKTVIVPPASPPAASDGAAGGVGGTGGDAGRSGNGGAGGQVQVGTVVAAGLSVYSQALGGDGGVAAAAGPGGPGGLGGAPGSFYVMGQDLHSVQVPGRTGPAGPQGPAAAVQGHAGTAGIAGAVAVACGSGSTSMTYADLAPAFPPAQLLITQRVASLAYLAAQTQQDYQQVLQWLDWLAAITTPFLDPAFIPAGWQATDIALAVQVNAFATAQLANFRAGLDFYGHPPEWVPLLTLSDYQASLSTLLAIGALIEAQFQAYVQQGQSAASQLAAAQATSAQMQATIQGLQGQVDGLGTQIQAAGSAIAAMSLQLEQQRNAIAQDQITFTAAFQQYVEQQAGHCSFSQILGLVSDVLQVGTGLVDGVGVVSGAFAAEGAMDTAAKQFKYAITLVEKVSSSVNAIQQGVSKIQAAIPASNPLDLAGMLATDQQDFDSFIAQFLDEFGAAVTLKQAVDDYFAMVNTLNQAILSYNGLYLTQANLQAQQAQLSQQVEQLAGVLAAAQPDPAQPACACAMQAAYAAVKAIIVQQLYEENRAYWFWSLQALPFATDDLTVASMAATHALLMQKISSAQEQSAAPYQPFRQPLSISAAQWPLAFAQLPATRQLCFSVAPDAPAFQNMYQVIAASFELSFPDIAPQSNVLFVELRHPGTCVQVGTDGVAVQFTHAQRTVPYKIDFSDPGNTAGGDLGAADQGFIGLSPLTLWTLDFSDPGNEWLDLSTIRSVDIVFEGTFVGPDGVARGGA